MRDLTIFDRFDDYRDFVFDEVVADRSIATNPFYANLIGWVLENRSPLFYRPSDPSEHLNFSNWYHLINRRTTYADPTLESLYLLHELAHITMATPHDAGAASDAEFVEAVLVSEYVASNETELYVYERVGGLRQRVFAGRVLLVDELTASGRPLPGPAELFVLRDRIIWGDTDGVIGDGAVGSAEERGELAAWYARFAGNHDWAVGFRRLAASYLCHRRWPAFPALCRHDYHERLAAWRPEADAAVRQARYQANVAANLTLATALCGLDGGRAKPAVRFPQAHEAAARLEGAAAFGGCSVGDYLARSAP